MGGRVGSDRLGHNLANHPPTAEPNRVSLPLQHKVPNPFPKERINFSTFTDISMDGCLVWRNGERGTPLSSPLAVIFFRHL